MPTVPISKFPVHMRKWRDKGGNLVCCALLGGPRLRRHKTCEAVIHNDLAVVFTAMFDDAVCDVENARFLMREINKLRHHAFFAFGLNGGGSVGKGFLYECDDIRLCFVLVALWISSRGRLPPHHRISEVVV